MRAQGEFWDGGPRAGQGLERESMVQFDRTTRDHATANQGHEAPFPMIPLLKVRAPLPSIPHGTIHYHHQEQASLSLSGGRGQCISEACRDTCLFLLGTVFKVMCMLWGPR